VHTCFVVNMACEAFPLNTAPLSMPLLVGSSASVGCGRRVSASANLDVLDAFRIHESNAEAWCIERRLASSFMLMTCSVSDVWFTRTARTTKPPET
jgi:hypothetical protein